MCLIIACEPTRKLPVKKFRAAINSAIKKNPDGIGIAWSENGKLCIQKRLDDYTDIINLAVDLYTNTSHPFAVHLRYNTVGKNSFDNTHPFQINDSVAMMHNKTLWIEPPNKQWSDSRTVAELLKKMCKGDSMFFASPLFYSFIEHQADMENRFVFLDAEFDQLIYINKDLGVEVDGVWFSNLYAWDSKTVGFRAGLKSDGRRKSNAYKGKSITDYSQSIEWDGDDVPLAWEPVGVGRRFVERF